MRPRESFRNAFQRRFDVQTAWRKPRCLFAERFEKQFDPIDRDRDLFYTECALFGNAGCALPMAQGT